MNFFSNININSADREISYDDKILFLGSCFSKNIGERFQQVLFDVNINPFGIIFNPISIFKLLDRAIEKQYYTKDDWIFFNEKWINLELHSDLSFFDLDEAISYSNKIIDQTHLYLKKTNFLFLTMGTAWAYKFTERNTLVANCHKIPQAKFEKQLLSVSEITSYSKKIIAKLHKINKHLLIIFTISPVRHLSDGAHNNNISKSVLFLAIKELTLLEKNQYFPSYEIIMDELRDYRFFGKDLVHPNEFAIDYVWEKIYEKWISTKTKVDIIEVKKIILAANHRPFDIKSNAHQKFIEKTIIKLNSLKSKLSFLNFEELEKKLVLQRK